METNSTKLILEDYCLPLPFELKRKIYSEFDNRQREILWFIKNTSFYSKLENDLQVVELLLALTIYYKRVLTSFDSATKFFKRLKEESEFEKISIGRFDLDQEQNNKLLAIIINFKKLKKEFGIPDFLFEYIETKDFLKKTMQYKEYILND